MCATMLLVCHAVTPLCAPLTDPVWPSKLFTTPPACTSHILTVPSSEHDTTCLMEGVNTQYFTYNQSTHNTITQCHWLNQASKQASNKANSGKTKHTAHKQHSTNNHKQGKRQRLCCHIHTLTQHTATSHHPHSHLQHIHTIMLAQAATQKK